MKDFENEYKMLCEKSVNKSIFLEDYKSVDIGLRTMFEDIMNLKSISREEFVFYMNSIVNCAKIQAKKVNNLVSVFDTVSIIDIIDNTFYELEELVAMCLIYKATGLDEETIKNEYYYIVEWGLYNSDELNVQIVVNDVEFKIHNVGEWYDYLLVLKNT